jgi:flagellar basal body-associated protein FliL
MGRSNCKNDLMHRSESLIKDKLKEEMMANINPLLKDDKIHNTYYPTFVSK